MQRKSPQPDLESIRFGSDGELLSGIFCAYCGNRNATTDRYCRHCGEYIADQGPDLTSRLARISRRAAGAKIDYPSHRSRMIGAEVDHADSFLENLRTSWP